MKKQNFKNLGVLILTKMYFIQSTAESGGIAIIIVMQSQQIKGHIFTKGIDHIFSIFYKVQKQYSLIRL